MSLRVWEVSTQVPGSRKVERDQDVLAPVSPHIGSALDEGACDHRIIYEDSLLQDSDGTSTEREAHA